MTTPRQAFVAIAVAATMVAIAVLATPSASPTVAAAGVPETVLITLRPKPGAEQELTDVIARHWAEVRRLGLVVASPHVTLRGRDGAGRIVLTEVLTWRDPSVPDAAPPPVLEIWNRMNELVEERDGKAGLVLDVVTVLSGDAVESKR
jgi:hypothetical protein